MPARHAHHDDVSFAYHEDSSISVDIDDSRIVSDVIAGLRSQFNLVLTPKVLFMFGRFLCKTGIELMRTVDSIQALAPQFDSARQYARYGTFAGIWPIFHYSHGDIDDLRERVSRGTEHFEEVTCYSYSIVDFESRYILYRFSMGTDNWVISLNDPFPPLEIMAAFPGARLDLIWYSDDQLRRPTREKN